MSDYSGGRIRRIKLNNFLTYDDLELFPSTGLNLIIGRNGTGKSSIVCGICLGLAGKPLFTGRATQISDYIKHGCKEASIEIELENKVSANVIITRNIRQDNKSSYHLNRRIVQEIAVRSVVEKFNIQTNNLCQFLPQEKVSEFSKMDKKQRLENMLRAIGDQKLYTWYEELKAMQKSYVDNENSINNYESRLEMEKQMNERLRVEVDKEEQKNIIKDEIKVLKDRKIVLTYKRLESEFNAAKKIKIERAAVVNEHTKHMNSLTNNEEEIILNLGNYEQKIRILKTNIDNAMKKAEESCSAVKELNDKVHAASIEFKNKIDENNNQKQRILGIKVQINGLKNSVESSKQQYDNLVNNEEQYKSETKKFQEEKSEILSRKIQLTNEINQIKTKIEVMGREIDELKKEFYKKMEVLRRKDGASYTAAMWLIKNKDKFKNVVHLPILTQIKVKNKGDEKFIESHIAFRDMIAFVCEDPDDSKLFVRILRDEMNLAINVVLAPKESLSHFQSKYSLNELKTMNFNCYVKDLFTAPDAVMRYLCNLYNIHQTPVGDGNAEKFIKTSNNSFPFSVCYTPHYKYVFKRSRYGNRNQSVTTSTLRNPSLLVSSGDVTEKIKNLEENLKKYDERKSEYKMDLQKQSEEEGRVSSEIEQRRKKLKEIEDMKRSMQAITASLTQKKMMLKDYEQRVFDETQEKRKTATYISTCYKKIVALSNETQAHIKLLLEYHKDKLKLCINQSPLLKKVQKLKRLKREAEDQLESAKKLLQDQKIICKKLYGEAFAIANDVQRIQSSPTWRIKISLLQDLTIEQIDQMIEMKQAQIDLTPGASERDIADYQQRKNDIANMEKEIRLNKNTTKELAGKMQEKKEKWLASLEGHIKRVNEKFKQYFKLLKCAGEIILDKNNNSCEFDKYGLQIMLKYRDSEPLMELSQHHHSGGECSVAAILFILSLQELTDVPFRCIDEINQGMDSINERKVFDLIANSANNEKSSQYFLLTPKLLPGLTYHEKMKIHVIYNGPFLDFSWNLKKVIKNRENCDDSE